MEIAGRTALVTGASRGLGRLIALGLAREGVAALGLAARSREALEELARELEGMGVRAVVLPADLAREEDPASLVHDASAALESVDILVNNAGIIEAKAFHRREPAHIDRALRVNLLAPMLLARGLLPGMLERGRGHVVNMASLGGKAAPPYQSVYGATKFGLVGFTQALRREYHGTGISASVICPGYVTETGMYADAREETGFEAPGILGRATPGDVVDAVIRAVRDDVPEIIVNSAPVRPLLALTELSPRAGEWLGRTLGLFRGAEEEARRRGQHREQEGESA